jgi:GTP cyclohydrolase IB
MNTVTEITVKPDRKAADAALATLRAWVDEVSPAEIAGLDPEVARMLTIVGYPKFFGHFA